LRDASLIIDNLSESLIFLLDTFIGKSIILSSLSFILLLVASLLVSSFTSLGGEKLAFGESALTRFDDFSQLIL
jgi:hypothetical protein